MLHIILLAVFSPILLVVIYRLYFHPLAKYPGPLVGRLTDWYNVYHCLKGDRFLDFNDLHERYGDVVRYGPNRLSFRTADALQAIHGARANTSKSKQYSAMAFFMKIVSTHSTIDKTQHARKRRILSQALSEKMVYVYEDGFRPLLAKFLKRYERPAANDEKGWSPAFDMAHELLLMNYDSMGRFCFGGEFGAMEDPEKAEISEVALSGIQGVSMIAHMTWMRWLRLDLLATGAKEAMDKYESHAAALAQSRMEILSKRTHKDEPLSCVFDILYTSSEKPGVEGFSVPELQSESSLLVTTGTDTIAGSVANVLFNLLNNPECLRTLTDEIRGTFSNESEIRNGPTLNNCKYLAACIDETLRLLPTVGTILPREVGPGGIAVDGKLIPEGTEVGVPLHTIMRNPKYYRDPLEYRPQRWLPSDTSADEIKLARSAFCPFIMGSTGCPGKAWAIVQMKITLAHLVFRYDLKAGTTEGWDGLSATQRLLERYRLALDRFVITYKGPCVKFRAAKQT